MLNVMLNVMLVSVGERRKPNIVPDKINKPKKKKKKKNVFQAKLSG